MIWVIMVLFALILGAVLWLGLLRPKPDFIATEPNISIKDPKSLKDWISQRESACSDLKRGTEAEVVLHNPEAPTRTPWAIVFVHGFSGSRQELFPLPENLAASLGANLYSARLSGHGHQPDRLHEATLSQWMTDVREAFAIGRLLGERVLLLGNSTGATLSMLGILRFPQAEHPDALVMLSPNHAPSHRWAHLLQCPGARWWVPLVVGKYRYWTPTNPEHAHYWSHPYRTTALFPMSEAVQCLAREKLTRITIPTLVLYSPEDRVVRPDMMEEGFAQLGASRKQMLVVDGVEDPRHHILAGNILSPGTTDSIGSTIRTFLAQEAPREDLRLP